MGTSVCLRRAGGYISSDVGEYGMKSNWRISDLGLLSVLERLVRELPSCSSEDGNGQEVSGPSRQHPPGRPQELPVLDDRDRLTLNSSVSPSWFIIASGEGIFESTNFVLRSLLTNVLAACRIGLYPVQRHKLPSRCPFISISSSERSSELVVGSYAFRIIAYKDMTIPGVQKPHLMYVSIPWLWRL